MSDTTPTHNIQVMIVDDHPMVRDGLKTFLLIFPDLNLVAEAGSGEEALERCVEAQPDVVLMDLKMPGMGGVAATRAIRQLCPHVQVLALTSFAEESLVQKVLSAGAIGYVLKDVSAADLANAIRDARVGRPTLSAEAAQALALASARPSPVGQELTGRELEILALIAEGMSNPDIAERLSISRSTANYHVGNILSKLGANNRTEAARLAVQHNLIP